MTRSVQRERERWRDRERERERETGRYVDKQKARNLATRTKYFAAAMHDRALWMG